MLLRMHVLKRKRVGKPRLRLNSLQPVPHKEADVRSFRASPAPARPMKEALLSN